MTKKSFTSLSICYIQEKNPFSFFFLKIIFFKLFVGILPLKSKFFLYANSNSFYAIIFKVFLHLLKFLIHSPAENLSNKKTRSFLRLLWAEIFPRQFTKFWHKRAIFCAPTVLYIRVQWFWLFFTFWGITTHPWHPKGPRIWKLAQKKFQLHPWPEEIFVKNWKMRFFSLVSNFNFRSPVWQIFTIFSACFIYGILNTHIKFEVSK